MSTNALEIERIRHRAAEALEKGLGFIVRHGAEMTILRAHVLLGAEPVEQLSERIGQQQNERGGFPPLGLVSGGAVAFSDQFRAAGVSEEVGGTLETLSALSDLGELHAPYVESAAGFLAQEQAEDGGWGLASEPAENRLFVTGMLTGLLGRTRVVRPHVLTKASAFMERLWSRDRIEGRAWPAITAFAVFFSTVDHDQADGALQWLGRELEIGYRQRAFDAASTLRALLHCQALGLPGASIDIVALLEDLLNEQGQDGGFAELVQDGDVFRVEPTLDAMLGILRLCSVI
ncbi:MAG: hypothetical protein VX252_07025 [Myxococcota bacterium]|nr:hypothetical protein [Myxococcota bacterium]